MVSAKGWTVLAAFIRESLMVLGTEIRHRDDILEKAAQFATRAGHMVGPFFTPHPDIMRGVSRAI